MLALHAYVCYMHTCAHTLHACVSDAAQRSGCPDLLDQRAATTSDSFLCVHSPHAPSAKLRFW